MDQKRLHPAKADMLTFPVEQMIDQSATDFDLYIEVSVGGDELTLFARAPYTWTKDELSRLLKAGHKHLYYSSRDQARVEAFQLLHQRVHINKAAAPEARLLQLTDAAAELTRILYNHPLTPAAFAKVGEIAKAMVTTVQEHPACVAALGNLASHDHYTYYHSARVAAYAVAIAIQLSQKDGSQLHEMATGALLHDIGKSKIDLAVLNKPGVLTKDEWELMQKHPVFGDAIVSDSLLAFMPRQIILHHHERLDGTGYPHQLGEKELLEEVKIAAFADVYDALTTNRPYQVSRTHFEALDFIRQKLLKKMHKDSYQALVSILAPELAST